MHTNKTIQAILKGMAIILIYMNALPLISQESLEDANVNLKFDSRDGLHYITASATDVSGSPIEGLDIYFYVERTFSLLPFGDVFNTTDENGNVTVQFPNDLPGSEYGNVNIHVKIQESDSYNDLDIVFSKKWGVPVKITDQTQEKRSLWAAAANAPISLILLVTGMIFAVWYIIALILVKLFMISRIKI